MLGWLECSVVFSESIVKLELEIFRFGNISVFPRLKIMIPNTLARTCTVACMNSVQTELKLTRLPFPVNIRDNLEEINYEI